MKIIEQVNNLMLNPSMVSRKKRYAYYPSEASIVSRSDGKVIGKCIRACWYDWCKFEPTNPVDARGLWTFKMGDAVEAVYIEQCKRLGIWAGDQIDFYDIPHNVSGRVDLFIMNHDQEIEGVEIKSAYGRSFDISISKYPKIENLLQVALYADYFKREYDINTWHLIYKCRDTQQECEYIIGIEKDDHGAYLTVDSVPLKMFYVGDIHIRYKKLEEHVIRNQEPPKDYTYGYSIEQSEQRCKDGEITKSRLAKVKKGEITDSDWQCLYCPHLDRCWSEKRASLKLR